MEVIDRSVIDAPLSLLDLLVVILDEDPANWPFSTGATLQRLTERDATKDDPRLAIVDAERVTATDLACEQVWLINQSYVPRRIRVRCAPGSGGYFDKFKRHRQRERQGESLPGSNAYIIGNR
ncbi:hypothetical protein [Burkholderia cenocepacia]|uniref:hypothetical protein n=1 Tax=Burkholderia cenocepacia TaxID=95486 RepID=UPI0012B6FBDF|nr:hypothetical protein [Burkholderia cenocepacia]